MKRDYRTLSVVREKSPFATPPRVLVVAEDDGAGQAVALAEALEAAGADAEVRFGADMGRSHSHSDAVIVADARGYRITRHHPVLENFRSRLAM
ncbi:hypothetical protein [Frigoriglobus tundricola]|uniref:Uncharacterized protein n=1 Tax=Frigoriglobus tundricola TaxID=2774151 RepID=A0A6M5YMG6_9BACT|nr:hypothetical protein [Frigoriglobus tundricola]QJW94431.1 hypothetical protein FTUN_1951 [Frigoriglobus tundricola]